MENYEIADVLNEVADLLEIQGENPFRVRAYRNAARTIDEMTQPLEDLVQRGADLEEIPTIGHDIAGYITELVRTGRLWRLEEARKKVPRSVTELTKLEGVGPKRATRLYRELGIRSVDDLEKSIARGKLDGVPGIGKKTIENLTRAIRDYRKHTERFTLAEADRIVEPLLEYMKRAPGIDRVEVAGSYRRRLETIGDIDLLATCSDAGPVMAHFTSHPNIARVEQAGPTRGTIVLRSGLHVDLRILPPESYGAALHYFTGSKAHNIAVRKLGIEKGLKINEYGIFRVGKGEAAKGKTAGKRIGGEEEEDVFRAVGMEPMPPEIREDRGEVQAAREGRLPRLVTVEQIRGDLQMHSTWSDGRNSIREMASAARGLGYEYIAVTDHSKAVTVAGGLGPRELVKQWKEIDRLNRTLDGLVILKGMEVDILADGALDLPDEYLLRLDLVIAAVHSRMAMPQARMTERIIRAMSHPAVDILAHPTGRIINRREPYAVDMEAVLQAAKEYGVALEINAHPNRLDLNDVHAFRARELGVKIAINTDAHSTAELRFMRYGVDQARRAWAEKKDIRNTMTLAALRKWLGRRHPGRRA